MGDPTLLAITRDRQLITENIIPIAKFDFK